MTIEEASGPAVEVWPDNVAAVNLFISLSTQWRVGPAGVTGLDYNTLPIVMRLQAIPRREQADAFECVRVLEEAAMLALRTKP